ncbi:MAG TPA: hypothetical protein VGD65_17330 [Chryseosolibacter sp.]
MINDLTEDERRLATINRPFILKYFNDIKRIYDEAAKERKCLVYRVG